MKRVLLSLVVVISAGSFLAGCCSVPEDVADSINVLHDNTYSLSASYSTLLDRAGPPPLPAGPEGETAEALAARTARHEATWRSTVAHKKALMAANNTLADRVKTWAAICAGREDQGANQ